MYVIIDVYNYIDILREKKELSQQKLAHEQTHSDDEIADGFW